ncbi:hypothetical protein [Azotobacter salinestris]|uniref:hypothetical protein n=1 Tax=Azotobacter salinestris TaxID=69964 RepID=UPI0032E02480
MKAASKLFIFCGKDGSFAGPTSSGGINASPHPRQLPSSPENGNLLADPAFPEWNFNSMGRVWFFSRCVLCSLLDLLQPSSEGFFIIRARQSINSGPDNHTQPRIRQYRAQQSPLHRTGSTDNESLRLSSGCSWNTLARYPREAADFPTEKQRKQGAALKRVGQCGEEDRKAESG